MEYTMKHRKLIADFFKKAGMMAEAETILSSEKFNCEVAWAIREAATRLNIGVGSKPALLDAARRYENRDCAIFKECPLKRCEGGVWCDIHNLGGSHGRIGFAYRHLAESASAIPLRKRRKLMFEYLAQKTGKNYTLKDKVTSYNPIAKLLHTEEILNKLDAEKREAQIKNWTRAKKLALAQGHLSQLRILSKSRD